MSDGLDRRAVADLVRRSPVSEVLALLEAGGEEARVVGGAVRNALIGRTVADIDICTTALPAAVVERAGAAGLRTIPTGIEHGTVTVLVAGDSVEVTTLREDVETTGRHAVVRFGRDFEADARRRDFTINALSAGPDGRLHDYAGGLDDLAARRVRFIGDPRQRIREDYLRILRLFRFHAAFGRGRLDRVGLAAALAERAGLAILSPERVRVELLKLLAAERAPAVIEEIAETGFLTLILGGVAELGRAARVRGGRDPLASLAALAVQTAEDADRLRTRLRLSNEEHGRLGAYAACLARLKSLPAPLTASDARRLAAEFDAYALDWALAATGGEPRPRIGEGARDVLQAFIRDAQPRPLLPLRGADFVAAGIPKGPGIGRLMAEARRRWMEAGCPEGEGVGPGLVAAVLAAHSPGG